jgi:ABC-type lipoprotein export system ATPase subunit
MLKRVASGHMSEIISAVDDSLERIDELYEEMLTSSRGAFLILRGDSGTGKSTFIHTVGLFRDGVDTKTVTKDEDVGSVLGSLNATDVSATSLL